MLTNAFAILAGFTCPIDIGTTPQSTLWMLPLALSIAVVYKATKLPKITTVTFIKETAILFGSIVAIMVLAAVCLYIFAWLATE